MDINSISQGLGIFDSLNSVKGKSSTDSADNGTSFLDTLNEKLGEVNDKQLQSDTLTQAFIQGDNVDIHQVMISSEEAKQSLQMAIQVRNKLLEAFQEINRMQL